MVSLTAATTTDAPPRAPTLYRPIVRDGQRGVDLQLHSGQIAAWDATARIVAVISGTQGGKTSFGPWWLLREIQAHGPGDYLAVTATFDLFKLKMLPALQEVFSDLFGIARYWSGDGVLELCQHGWDPVQGVWAPVRDAHGQPVFGAERASDVNAMWGRIIMRSASAEGGLESATAHAAWLDEAGQDTFGLGAWEAVLRRLSLSRGRVLITTTPYNLGWLKQRVYDRWRAGAQHIRVIQFPSVANPAFSRAEFEERQQEMDDWKFRMFYEGRFERPAGLIYRAFVDRYRHAGGHKVRPFSIPMAWPRWGGIDPGAVHHAKVWLAYDPATTVYYLYRESLMGELATAEHAAAIRRFSDHARVVLWFVGQKAEQQQRLDYQAAGLHNVAEPPIVDVESGIDHVIRLFKTHRLFVFDDCTGVLDELGSYRRKLDENDQPTAAIHNKERYHRLDALRYVVAGVEGAGYEVETVVYDDTVRVTIDY
jgi:hypothetical protein